MTIDEVLQDIVNKDYDELLVMARRLLGDFIADYKKTTNITDDLLAMLLATVISSAVATDDSLTALEEKFLSDLLGLDKEKIVLFANVATRSNNKIFTDFFGTLNAEQKSTVALLLATIISCDEKINPREHKFFMSLLSM